MVALGDIKCSCGKIFTGDQLGRSNQKCPECTKKIEEEKGREYQERRKDYMDAFCLADSQTCMDLAGEIFDLREELKELRREVGRSAPPVMDL